LATAADRPQGRHFRGSAPINEIQQLSPGKPSVPDTWQSADTAEDIVFRMEQQGLRRRDLEEIIGIRTRIAEVLNRKRGLSIAMIRRLHERLASRRTC
jgi:hypothetical protein